MLELSEELRAELKDPVGPLYTDPAALLADAGRPLVAVGDVVTTHLLRETTPDVALVDGLTKRTELPDDERVDTDAFDSVVHVENPAATLSRDLLVALADALASDESTVLLVEGEEDLAAVPAIAVAPDGASVVYGQPDEGMVHVRVDDETRAAMREFLARMEGDGDGANEALGIE
ncbi:GTP-dependent dephospho-CoA kinase family protein [Halomarina oriensis]|uniref:GTP-dependent dephospho-CoA kinase n=1 Tax=Halomarina oriensis TaxID=671145 RepID=A0A6B0GHC7_9EURY|nr:DUF359 domain-containing protein [Halomarina oriensis]MWG34272.1 DUF359 domain-containing protein [Halomarina oriensis]